MVRGYYPEPSKKVFIVHLDNIKDRKRFGLCHGFHVCTGARYLGIFIRDDNSKCDQLKYPTETWDSNINTIIKTIGKYTQESCSAVVHVIQLEWSFLQRVTKNTGDSFLGVEKMLRETFFLCLFFIK